MIKKLKKKFIFINMLLAAIVLNVSFLSIGISTYERLSTDSKNALEHSFTKEKLERPQPNNIGMPPERRAPSQFLKSLVFNVKLTQGNKDMTIMGDNIDYDMKTISGFTNYCLKENKVSGVISEYHLRYMMKKSDTGTEFAFYDLSNDIHTMEDLIKNFILVEIGSLIAFFLISFYLAKWALKPLEISWKQQKQFVADASHEMKTPLTVILANTDILETHKSESIESQYKWLDYIKTEATHMSTLVNDLLFLANSDASRESAKFSKLNLSDIAWNCYLPFEPVAFEQGKCINNSIDSDVYINGDEGKLTQLIMILLDNACKYTDKNGHIDVSLKQRQEKVYFSITNYGTPIAPDHLPHLFERFYRADESRTRETGGHGLGLSIAKTITDMQHGKILVTSNKEAGTTFTVVFSTYKY